MRRSIGERRRLFVDETNTQLSTYKKKNVFKEESDLHYIAPSKRRNRIRGFNRPAVSYQWISQFVDGKSSLILIPTSLFAIITTFFMWVILSVLVATNNQSRPFTRLLSEQDFAVRRLKHLRDPEYSTVHLPAFINLFVSQARPLPPEHVHIPAKLDHNQRREAIIKDFGSLNIRFFSATAMSRIIHHEANEEKISNDNANEPKTDDMDNYYAFDDDFKRNPYTSYEDKNLQFQKHCRRTSWHRKLATNCNSVHEIDLLSLTRQGNISMMGEGSYRQIFRVDLAERSLVLKAYYWAANYDYSDYEFTRMDGLVSEIFSSSPNVVNIYGFCGLWMLVELMAHGDLGSIAFLPDEEYTRQVNVDWSKPRNHLSSSQKLQLGLQMAEALALLHSYPGGVIVHDDIHPGQFLTTDDGHLKLHDFNRAEIMLWNEKDGEYCRYRNHPGNGEWRSPEEYKDLPLNEKIDVWSLGNNLYALLTGLDIFVNFPNTEAKQLMTLKGQTPFIHPAYFSRSFAERKLVEVIKKCWVYEPDKRIDVFEVVDYLRDAIKENSNAATQ